jgi:hypothetical protein
MKIFTAVKILMFFFLVELPCGLVDTSQRSGEAYFSVFRAEVTSQPTKKAN